jgi:hypothetical protein
MTGKTFFVICAFLFNNNIKYEMPSSYGYVDYIKYTYKDTTHTLYFEDNVCIQDEIEVKNNIWKKNK